MTGQKAIELEKMQAATVEACKLLKALSHPGRLLLLCQMTQGSIPVNELETVTGIRQPTLSQQLTVLREEGLVDTRRQGKQIFYSIASAEALTLLQVLYQLYCPTE